MLEGEIISDIFLIEEGTYSIVPSSGLQSGLMPPEKVSFGWFSGVLSWSVFGVRRRLRNSLILASMDDGIIPLSNIVQSVQAVSRQGLYTGIVPFLWKAASLL